MPKKKKCKPKWFRHEALHTTHVCTEMVYDHLVNHHYYDSKINPDFNKQIDLAIDHLFNAYQIAGNPDNEVKKKMKVNI